MYIQYPPDIFSYSLHQTQTFFWSDMWMLPTLEWVWKMHCAFVKISLCISDQCKICLIEQLQTLPEIQSDILTNPQCICQTHPRVGSTHMSLQKNVCV